MIAKGIVIRRDQDHAQALRAHISNRLASGPLPLSMTALNALRYEITDAVNNLRGERTVSDVIAIGAMLHPKLVELTLCGRGHWNGAGR